MYQFNRHNSDSENEVVDTTNDLEAVTENLNCQSTSYSLTTSSNNIQLLSSLMSSTSSSSIYSDTMSSTNFISNSRISRKRQKIKKINTSSDKLLSSERIEEIHKALSKMIAINQMPLSFCSSLGFKYFMNVFEPNYKPCSAESVKYRLKLLTSDIKNKIKNELNEVTSVSCSIDCWTPRSQESYITITCHTIDQQWKPKSFTLTTHKVDERHTTVNVAHNLENSLIEWEIEKKVIAIVTDNATNVLNAVSQLELNDNMEKSGLTCAAHSLQLAVDKTLSDVEIQNILMKSSKIVKHSSITMKALEKMQQQLNKPKLTLLQYCKTRWNSSFLMLKRLYLNRTPILNVLSDRTMTVVSIAQNLEISEYEWLIIEKVLVLLKPLQALTTLFSGELESSVSMVRPLIHKIITSHYKHGADDDSVMERFKNTISYQLTTHFELTWKEIVSARHIASFLDPRYKNMDHEPIKAKEIIRSHVLQLIESSALTITKHNEKEESDLQISNVLAFIYNDYSIGMNDAFTQFTGYLSELQLRFDLNPLEWWKTREDKYPAIAALAKKYLAIPSTPASSERCFSTAENIVTSQRSFLLPENIDMLVFLYQNRKLYC